jgi:hypothetical protein
MKKRILMYLIAAFSLICFAAHNGLSETGSASPKAQKIIVKGKIDYDERFGGYYIRGENPPSQLFIVNPDSKKLEELKKRDANVQIEGRLTMGADHINIDKINGQKYP